MMKLAEQAAAVAMFAFWCFLILIITIGTFEIITAWWKEHFR